MDNWFTSVPLAEKLLKQHKITVIGTIRKDKKELPADFVNLKFQDRKVNSSLSLFSENVTAASYKATEKKLATLISTLHDDEAIHPGSGKPEIIMNYNETKGVWMCWIVFARTLTPEGKPRDGQWPSFKYAKYKRCEFFRGFPP